MAGRGHRGGPRPRAIEGATRRAIPGATFVVGDVTDLSAVGLGGFDLCLDVGCFQGLGPGGPRGEALRVTSLANPGASRLLMASQPTRGPSWSGAATRADGDRAFDAWQMLSVEPAETAGLGWPLNRTPPQWYRLRLP